MQTHSRRVLLWSDAFPPAINGVAVFIARFTELLLARGYDVGVITNNDDVDAGPECRFGQARVWRFPFQSILAAKDVERFHSARHVVAQIKALFAADLVHVHSVSPSVLFHLRTRQARPTRTVFSLHRMLPESIGREGVIGQGLNASDWIITNSQSVLQNTLRRVPEITGRASVIYYGIDEPTEVPVTLPFSPPRLLCIGRLENDKGFDTAIRAMSLVTSHFPQSKLTIAGDGDARSALESQAREHGLADVVEFLGWVQPGEVPRLINTSTLVIMPSRWDEPFGLVALETGAMARPIVATRVGGLPEVVLHGVTGLLCDKNDPVALAKATMELLHEPDRATRMGKSAREHVLGHFSWSACLQAYDILFRRLIDSAKHSG